MKKNFYWHYRYGNIEFLNEVEAIEETLTNGTFGVIFDNAILNGLGFENLLSWATSHTNTAFVEKTMLANETYNLGRSGGHVSTTSKISIIRSLQEVDMSSATVGLHRGGVEDILPIVAAEKFNLTPVLAAYHEAANSVRCGVNFLYKLSELEIEHLFRRGERIAQEEFRNRLGFEVKKLKK